MVEPFCLPFYTFFGEFVPKTNKQTDKNKIFFSISHYPFSKKKIIISVFLGSIFHPLLASFSGVTIETSTGKGWQ